MTFNQYFSDQHSQYKKPTMRGSKKQAFGDNIYFRDAKGWHQLASHHSNPDGTVNSANVKNDTQTDRMLLSSDFVYFGGDGPKIPAKFRNHGGIDVCALRNHKSEFPLALVQDVAAWIRSLRQIGCVGRPLEWAKST
jgi:hypothetical protein